MQEVRENARRAAAMRGTAVYQRDPYWDAELVDLCARRRPRPSPGYEHPESRLRLWLAGGSAPCGVSPCGEWIGQSVPGASLRSGVPGPVKGGLRGGGRSRLVVERGEGDGAEGAVEGLAAGGVRGRATPVPSTAPCAT